MPRVVSRAQGTPMGRSQGIEGGVEGDKQTGSGSSSLLTFCGSLGPSQPARPNRHASCSLCTEPAHTEEGRAPSQERGRKEAHPPLLAPRDAPCAGCPACPTLKSLSGISLQTSPSLGLGVVTGNPEVILIYSKVSLANTRPPPLLHQKTLGPVRF